MSGWREIPGNPGAFDKLVEVLASGEPYAFVGAGASAGLYPLWPQLIERLADEAVAAGADPAFKKTWREMDALQAARQIRKRLGEGAFADIIREIFGPKSGPGRKYTATHEMLARMGFRGFVTTNYDPALTLACQDHYSELAVRDFDWRHDRVALWLQGRPADDGELPILHAHGQYDSRESLVLDAEDYRRAYGDNRYRRLFEKLWTFERLVVVGFSFRDAWLRIVADEALSQSGARDVSARRHFALIGLPEGEEAGAELHREAMEEQYHLRVLFYPVTHVPTSDGGHREDHSALGELLEELRTASAASVDSTVAASKDAPGPSEDSDEPEERLQLRLWDPPGYPADPYPLLLPYSHPDLLAGRERELEGLRRKLSSPIPILGLYSPSGAGKSSLLQAALAPGLRAEGLPVALDRHPQEKGLAGRLIGQLLLDSEGERLSRDATPAAFVEALKTVRDLAGEPAVLVLDQFEDVLGVESAQAEVGVLLAATVGEQLAGEAPLARWVLSHRHDFHGSLRIWLEDVLRQARKSGRDVEGLPCELQSPDRFHSWALPLLGAPPSGDDGLDEPLRAFRAAIEAPLTLRKEGGTPRYRKRFAEGSAERLARAFAEARLQQPEAPLTPELQVVLAHLGKAGEAEVTVGEKPEELITDALGDHLHRVLKAAFPADGQAAARRRARALLALRELADAQGRTDEGLPASRLAAAIGGDGAEILDRLAAANARLIVAGEEGAEDGGKRYVLSHDRLAEVVVQAVEEEGGKLALDRELLGLRKVVTLNTELYRESGQPADLSRQEFRGIETNEESLLWDEDRRAWWRACRERRHSRQRNRWAGGAIGLVVAVLMALGVWRWVKDEGLLAEVVSNEATVAFGAVNQLSIRGVRPERISDRLRKQEIGDLLEVFELGPDEVPEMEWGPTRLNAVRAVLPSLAPRRRDDLRLLGVVAWVLDDTATRYPALAEEARQLRSEALRPFKPPPSPPADDPDWVDVVGGTFKMGDWEGVGRDNELPVHVVTVSSFRMLRHEVTVEEYCRLVPDHPGEGAALPVIRVDWYSAYAYAAWLGGRLPTEAEWEYAARAGCATSYCDEQSREVTIDEVAWYGEGFEGEVHEACSPEKSRNPLGLCDMIGNAWEWVADWYGPYSEGPDEDPWGPSRGVERVIRGGSYVSSAAWARSASRNWYDPGYVFGNQGFRVLLPSPSSGPSAVDPRP